MNGAPFEEALKSPITQVLSLRADGPAAVVSGPLDDIQNSAVVRTSLEGAVVEAARSGDYDLILVGGSAGGGKSMLIERLLTDYRDLFGDVVRDATHADAPSRNQAEQLRDFLAPFADEAGAPPSGPPRLLAANTGMVIELFRQLADQPFGLLETVLKTRLGVRRGAEPETPWGVLVINLDLRPTAGDHGLIQGMIEKLDFDNEQGITGGAARCATCGVRDWCPVRANARHIVRSAPALDLLAGQAALERGRHDSPRQLWDWLARLVTGDDSFAGYADPCFAVAKAADDANAAWVWERLLPRVLFCAGGDLGRRVRDLDPSIRPSPSAHRLIARAGIEPQRDAEVLGGLLPDPGSAALRHVESGGPDGETIGRATVAASFLRAPGEWEVLGDLEREWGEVLREYQALSVGDSQDYPLLEELPSTLERALAAAFGFLHRDIPYIPVSAYDPREPSRVSVRLTLDLQAGNYEPLPDPAYQRDEDGASVVGHRPLVMMVALGGERDSSDRVIGAVEVSLDLPLYRLLRGAEGGTLASTADLARFYGLRRAVEALSRRAAGAESELLAEHPTTGQRYLVRHAMGLRGDVIKAQVMPS